LPRIGALVGAETLRPLPAESGVSIRAFIGNLLRYRRAKGTAAALEMLARDVTGYSAKAVEYFQRLSVTQTLRAPRPDRAGTATMRDPDGRARHGGAFDANPRTPDMRSIARAGGRHNIPNVGLFLWRLEALPYAAPPDTATEEQLATVPVALPWGAHVSHFAMLPDGRPVPFFSSAHNDDSGAPDETEVPQRLRRLPLWRELEAWREAIARNEGASFPRRWFAVGREPFAIYVRRVNGAVFDRIPSEQVMIGALEPVAGGPPPWTPPPATKTYKVPAGPDVPLPVAVVLDPATGRMVFAAPAAGQADVAEVRVAYAQGIPGALGGGAYDRNDSESVFDVPLGSLVYLVGAGPAAPGTTRFADLVAALGAWAANGTKRTGFIVLTGNHVDLPAAAVLDVSMPADSNLTIVAAEWRSPTGPTSNAAGFIVRRSRRAMLLRQVAIRPAAAAANPAGRLTLDGVYADQSIRVGAGALSRLDIRHATLLPTSSTALDLRGTAGAPLEVRLFRVSSGPIVADQHVGALHLEDCIVARSAAQPSIDAPSSEIDLEKVTLFGGLMAKVLNASNSILMGLAKAERRQQGCVRYSYVGEPSTDLPRRYRCQPELALAARAEAIGRDLTPAEADAVALGVRPAFVDVAPDEPGYALLELDAPAAIRLGGEGESEMGAWAFLGGSIRLANLNSLLGSYMPFGLEGGVLPADLSASEARGSNVP
jgi:hypothetical protein